jgi:hypothetical protein
LQGIFRAALLPGNLMMARIGCCLTLLLGLFTSEVVAQSPGFLPPYYQEALNYDGTPLVLTSQGDKEGVKRAVFQALRGPVGVVIEQIACERPQCAALLEQNLKRQNERMGAGGAFRVVSASEYVAAWNENSKSILLYFAKLPAAIEVWTRVTEETSPVAEEPYVSDVRRVLNRRRYEDARQGGNVDTGVWSKEIAQHVRDLRAARKVDEAFAVLTQLIVWAPANFEAQIDFAETTKDTAAGRASALVVWDNAEDQRLRARAAKLLGLTETGFESLPVLEPGSKGLQVVLIPLPPCDLRLIEEAARQFSSSFDLPAKIARLPVDWTWQGPERVYRERELRGTIVQKSGAPVDFGGWSKNRYAAELAKATSKDDPLARYWIADFLRSFGEKPGQFKVDGYLAQLSALLKPYRTGDRRTMFVGVSGQDIYSGDSNFVFSSTMAADGNPVSMLSYARMQSAMTGEPLESRKRTAQRLAKELVPAALKQLEIARPADPSDPYSYSDGLQRLDEKSLTLSTSTREAPDKFRAP